MLADNHIVTHDFYNKLNNKGRRLLLLVFLCIGGLWVGGDTTHATPPISGNTIDFADSGQSLGSANSYHVALGDVDGDGDLDAFVANNGAANTVWTNDGDGVFTDSTQTLGTAASYSVALGDIDGDGDLDAFVANNGAANTVWTNDGDGTFTDSTQTLGTAASYDVELGDVDEDGDLDAFVANNGAANTVWTNDGDGTFTDSTQTLGSAASYGVTLGDVDGDGDLDAFVANNGAANTVWTNDGDGTFTDSTQTLGTAASYDVALGDIDGDGDLDAFVANNGAVNTVWTNDGDGVFTDSTQTLGSANSTGVELGDVDADGDLDAFVTNNGVANKVWSNDGTGVYTDTGLSMGSENSWAVMLGDVDKDGDLDAFVANSGGANKVWTNNNIHRKVSFSGLNQSFGTVTSYDVALGDIDRDGDLDAFVAMNGANKVYTNNGSGTFTDSGQTLGNVDSNAVALGDVNGDGDLDAIVANFNQDVKVWTNDGTGTFTDSGQDLGGTWSVDVALGDVDGDGDLDVFVVNSNDPNTVWINDGDGTFTDSTQTLGNAWSVAVALGDVDSDGDLDAFVANRYEANTVWTNDGDGTFTDSGQTLGSTWSADVALGDVDSDGDLDAFVANRYEANTVWTNDGDGTFTDSGQTLGGTADSSAVALGDFDQDGDLDAVVANDAAANKVWLNGGTGTFSDGSQSIGSADASGVVLGDVDNDGQLDIFVTNYDVANSVWVDTGGGAVFSATSTNPIVSQGFQVITEDDLLKFTITNNGISGDPTLELNQISLDVLQSDCSTALTSSQANNLMDYLRVRVDDGDGTFETSDTQVANIDTLSLTDGVQLITFTNDDSNVQVAATNSKTFWISIYAFDDASKQSPNRMCLKLDPDADVLIEGKGTADFSVPMQDTSETSTGQVYFRDPPTLLEIEATDAERTEGDSGNRTFTFTVTRSGTLTGSSSVNYSVSGSGTNPANSTDFGGSYPSGTVNFVANDTSEVISINVSGDTDVEYDETFTVTLTSPTNAVIETATAVGTIQNEDTGVSITAASATKAEGDSGNTAFTFTVSRSGDRSGSSSVNYAVTGSGANQANAADFGGSLPSGNVSFGDNETSKTVTINVSGDTDIEEDETFTVTLSNPSGMIIETATAGGTIENDDTYVSIAATSADKAEGDSGNTALTFTVTRSGYTSGTSSVSYAVTGSGAEQADADDFGGSLPSGSVSFAASDTSKVITVNVSGDTDVETDETFTVTLDNPSGTNIDTDTADGTIQNDDTRVDIGATSASKAEGDSGNLAFTFTVTRTGFITGASSVAYVVTGNGTDPANAADFGGSLPSGSVDFVANDTSKVITVNVSGDTDVENDETFIVALSNPSGTTIGTSTANGTIQNDDTSVAIAATSANKEEGDSGTVGFTFTVTRTGVISGASSVAYAVTGGGANPADADDFGGTLPSGNVDFVANDTSKVITVNVNGDTDIEYEETFTVTLSTPTGTTISTATAVGTIQDDDSAVVISESDDNTITTEGGSTDSYTVVLTDQPTEDVLVAITPDAQTDLGSGAGISVTLTFTDGNWDEAQTVTVTAVDDDVDEGSHSSTITHSAASSDGLFDGTSIKDVTVTITDNDSAAVKIVESAGSTGVTEEGTTDSYTVVLNTKPTSNVSIQVAPDAQTNLGNGAGSAVTLTFTDSNWDTTQTVTVTAVDDDVAEGSHSSTITHSATSSDGNYNGISIVAVTSTITDNDTAGVELTEFDKDTAVSEDGDTDTYDIVLTSKPAATVVVTLTPDSQVKVSRSSFTFTPSDWDSVQTVRVTAVDDDDNEGLHTGNITHSVSSSDTKYNNLSVRNIVVNITDNVFYVFLPMVVNNYAAAPDLVVKEIAVDGSSVTVTIENQGSAPVTEEFWVDLYLNPTVAPTRVNEVWEMFSIYGAAWGVVEPGLLNPDESLVLTLNDVYFDPSRTNLPNVISAGSTIYVQVDSANTLTSFGGVLEAHETTGEDYNNIESITTTSSSVFASE